MALTRSDLTGKVQTVTGLIDPDDLGQVLMHEHLFIDLTPPHLAQEDMRHEPLDICNCFRARYGQEFFSDEFRIESEDIVVAELTEMKKAGGRTVVDLTVGGLGPRPAMLRSVSERTGLPIIMGSGHYVNAYQDAANAERSAESFAEEITGQILDGAWGDSARAGIIGEIGCQTPWTDQEKRVMEGALAAQAATGAALNVHPGRMKDQPQEVAAFCAARGAPMDRVILSHIDRTIFDEDTLFRLADTGVVIEYDLFGWETTYYWPNPDIDLPNDGVRLQWLRKLIARGHLDQILISHDICTKGRLERFGGHGFQHIFANVLPLMRRRGFTEAEISRIMVDTPRRLLTFA